LQGLLLCATLQNVVISSTRALGGNGMLAAPRRAFVALVLVVLTLVSGGCVSKTRPSVASGARANLAATSPSGALQEVAPPGAVQQLNERLNERAPQVRVLAPADNALLPAGAWTLELQVSDWPLADAGDLGLGPHVVVQLDNQEPLRISTREAAAKIAMPDLRPGSHRVTVYAARPWGEAVKAPGASAQIRINRVARNAAELPSNGSAQLIAASPDALQQVEPVLVDWLLLDAPLQNLRGDDARWRLRISVNGDSFLVDRQTPLWLKGFKRGSNAVQLELLDGRGDPLNPPFNSVVREVVIGSGSRPAWLKPSLSTAELARLAGEQPATEPLSAIEAAPVTAPAAEPPAAPVPALEPEAAPEQAANPEPEPNPTAPIDSPTTSEDNPTSHTAPVVAAPIAAASEPEDNLPPVAEPAEEPPKAETTPAQSAPIAAAEPGERLSPQSRLSGSAREQVNADGSLQQPPSRGPLAGLREKLGG
jgi:hypothetical protein